MHFNGSTCYTIPVSSLTFGTNNFTIAGWFYYDSSIDNGTYVWPRIFTFQKFYNMSYVWQGLQMTLSEAQLTVYFQANTIAEEHEWMGSSGITNKTWTHFAITRNDSTVTSFVNGVIAGTKDVGTSAIYQNPNAHLVIGAGWGETEATKDTHINYFPGYMEDFIICNGTSIWNTAFTPPTTPWNVTNMPSNAVVLFPGDSNAVNTAITSTAWTSKVKLSKIDAVDITSLRTAVDSLNTYVKNINNCDCAAAGSYCQSCQSSTNQACQSAINQSCQNGTNQACQSSTNQKCQSTTNQSCQGSTNQGCQSSKNQGCQTAANQACQAAGGNQSCQSQCRYNCDNCGSH